MGGTGGEQPQLGPTFWDGGREPGVASDYVGGEEKKQQLRHESAGVRRVFLLRGVSVKWMLNPGFSDDCGV